MKAPALFFDTIRPLFRRLTQAQVDGLNALLAEALGRRTPLRQLAYILATVFHETGGRMQPVTENLRYTSAERIRAVWPSRFKTVADAMPFVRNPEGLANKVYGGRADLGNTDPDDAWEYRGRGLVQLTGRDNYARAGLALGLPLLDDPDLALKLEVSAEILFEGMERGWFTGISLADAARIPGYEDDRRIINGTDQAARIARYAETFERALEAAAYAQEINLPPLKNDTRPLPRPKEGAQKAVVSSVPNLSVAVALLVNYATGAVGLGEVPPEAQVQAAIVFVVLAAVQYAVTWYVPNAKAAA